MSKPKQTKEEKAIYDRQYREDNREKLKEKNRKYYIANKKKIDEWTRQYKINNKDKIKERGKKYYASNKESFKQYYDNNSERINKHIQNRRKNDEQFRLRLNLSSRIYQAIKNTKKQKDTIALLGCSIKELRVWLENQFINGMTWDNYGEWEVDHVYPLAKFNLEQPYEQKIAFNWFNLQPLWARDNRIKHDKLYI